MSAGKFEFGHYRMFANTDDEALELHRKNHIAEYSETVGTTKRNSRSYHMSMFLETVREREYRKQPYDLGPVEDNWEGKPFPLQDEPDMVRAIHEGICPKCGRQFVRMEVSDTDPQDYLDLPTITGHCFVGHKATAEPSQFGDWGAYTN